MSEPNLRLSRLSVWLLLLTVGLMAGYIGSYFRLTQRIWAPTPVFGRTDYYPHVAYKIDNAIVRIVYRPLEAIDRRTPKSFRPWML